MMMKNAVRACLLLCTFLLASQDIVAKAESKQSVKDRPVALYLTHGLSYINTPELERLGVPEYAFTIGLGVGYDLLPELALNTELIIVDVSRKNVADNDKVYSSEARTWFHQERATIGLSYKKRLGRNFILFPEAGLALNHIKVGLSEKSYHLETSQRTSGWYWGLGAVVPIRRVFIDFRYKYQEVNLNMEAIGADKKMFQSTLLIGFGFVI